VSSRTANEQRLLAYHEAGHAVANHALNLPNESITIVPDAEDGTAGFAKISDSLASKESGEAAHNDAAVWRRLLTAVAGPVAGTLEATGKPFVGGAPAVDWADPCYGDDLEAASECCSSLSGPEAAVLDDATVAVTALLRARWDALERLAEELLERKRLGAERIRQLLAFEDLSN
jgi:ATP-dependent Zn protease